MVNTMKKLQKMRATLSSFLTKTARDTRAVINRSGC
jgi:hypothetical protein